MQWLKLGARDLLIVAITVIAWIDVQGRGEMDTPWWLSVTAGLLLGISGFLLHEWGHLIGAHTSGGRAVPARSLRSIFLFAFDVQRSSPRQFLAMSYGGYIASILGLGLVFALVSLDRLSGQVALGFTGFGLLVTAVLEIPTTVRVLRGRDLPTGFAYVGTPKPREPDAPTS
jgi:hypothetical protein